MKSTISTAIIFLIAVLFSVVIHAQQNVFVKAYVVLQSSFTQNFELVKTYDNGYMVGNRNCLLRVDSIGSKIIMWYNDTLIRTQLSSINKTQDGGYICAGLKRLIKLDSLTNIIWVKEFSTSGFYINTIREASDKGFILGGYLQITNVDARALLIKTDSVGNVIWSNLYKTTGTRCDFLTLTNDSGFIICGNSISLFNPLSSDICIMKINANGSVLWAKHHAFPNMPGPYTCHIVNTSDNSFVISGGMNTQFLLKIDESGNKLWLKEYLPQIPSVAQSVEETADGGLIMGGYLLTFGGVLMKTDSAGNFQWVNTLSGPNIFGGSVKPTADGGYVMAARVSGANGHGIEIFKTDSLGQTGGCIDYVPSVTVTNVNDTVINMPVIDSVLNITTTPVTITFNNVGIVYDFCPTGLQNIKNDFEATIFPNPTSAYITIQYNFLQNAFFKITDVSGRNVKQELLLKNLNETTVDLTNLKKGIYFYTVQCIDGNSKSGKFVKY
jgi:hypothetical protein